MVEFQPSKLAMRVRSPSPALSFKKESIKFLVINRLTGQFLSIMTLIPIKEALQTVIDSVKVRRPDTVNILNALNLVSAQEVISKINIPPFENSQMDGFAISVTESTKFPLTLDVVETVFAGHNPKKLIDETVACRIFTGAKLNVGANAVAMQENCDYDTKAKKVIVNVPVAPGENIRTVGDDVSQKQVIIPSGTIFTPAVIGLAASCGIDKVKIIRPPKIGIVSTGSELMSVGKKLMPAKIYDSNRLTLSALVKQLNLKVYDFGIIPDDISILTRLLKVYSKRVDVLIISGGVSVGDADFVKTSIQKLCPKNSQSLQIAIKPAKPFAYGTNDNCIFFGLPGNPVSATVSFELLVKPALKKMMGYKSYDIQYVKVEAKQDIPSHNDSKTHYLRVMLKKDINGNYSGVLSQKQGSHNLLSLANSNALAEIPNRRSIKKGQFFKAIVTDSVAN